MRIKIQHLIEGARQAAGLAVIIDVFRAFTVEAYLAAQGAERIIPVGDIEIAYAYKRRHPDAVLLGEREGRIQEGFDYGNSPSQIFGVDFHGKTAVHTTSAGTQGLVNAAHADEILAGSLVTADAIARYIRQKQPETVTLVCMGLGGRSETEEDLLCARYIKSLLEDRPISPEAEIGTLKQTSGRKFFDPAMQDIFPERDFYLCMETGRFPFVLRYLPGEPFGSIQRFDV